MKRLLIVFTAVLVACPNVARAATVVKKAAPVAVQQKSATDATSSLLPTVLNLVSAVKDMNAKTKALTEECVPTAAEISFVNDTIKEWAKTGAMTADEARRALGMKRCENGATYERVLQEWADENDEDICFDSFNGPGNAGTVWDGFPMASKATYCADGSYECGASQRKTASNIYNVFNLIDFTVDDYTVRESKMAAQLTDKIEKCSSAKLSAAKRMLWKQFLTDTISSVGQPTNSGAIMEQVSAISSSGFGGGLNSLSGLAGQFMNK